MPLTMGVGCLENGDSDLRRALSESIQLVDSLKNNYGSAVQIYDEKLRTQLRENHEREKLLESADAYRDFVAYYQAKWISAMSGLWGRRRWFGLRILRQRGPFGLRAILCLFTKEPAGSGTLISL